MRTIALERGLEMIAEALQAEGYEIVYADEISAPVSAYIYHETINELQFDTIGSLLNHTFQSSAYAPASEGVLLINARNKSADEILRMIANRCYSPIF